MKNNMSLVDNVVVETQYLQRFSIDALSFEPDLASAEHTFEFEKHRVAVRLPGMPPDDQPIGDERAPSYVSVRRTSDLAPVVVDAYTVQVTIFGLSVEIPAAAANYGHPNASLYSSIQTMALDEYADRYYYRARRLVDHWIRILWWKTGYPLIEHSPTSSARIDGGSLVNCATGTRFYTPRVGRTVSVSRPHLLKKGEWLAIGATLTQGLEPPIWHDYLASAYQRVGRGDTLAAFLDLAIASEARIRTFLSEALPSDAPKISRQILRRMNMNDIFGSWDSLGIPAVHGIEHLRLLFDIRNVIMHSGKEVRANRDVFLKAAEAVRLLVVALGASD